ncbi:hypothetical protein [Streptomyces sp. bgisy126]
MANVRTVSAQDCRDREPAVMYSPSAAKISKGFKEAQEGVSDVDEAR